MLRLGRGIRIQYERASASHVLLFPEGLVDLNASAHRVLSRVQASPSTREALRADLAREFKGDALEGLDSFLDDAIAARWIVSSEP